jgi:pimeloyl-ACP methyl ester carboxylesterase
MYTSVIFPANGLNMDHYRAYHTLKGHAVHGVYYRPHQSYTPPPRRFSWEWLMDTVVIPQSTDPRVGIGHSLGGTLLLYDALKNPHRWHTLVIIDPALFSPAIIRAYRVIRWLGIEDRLHPMIIATKKRRQHFTSIADTVHRWRNYPLFKQVSSANLHAFVEASLHPSSESNGYTLRFSRDWETAIYRNMCSLDGFIWLNLNALKPRLWVIAGETSNTFLKGARHHIRPYCDQFITIPNTTHLIPFEAPLDIKNILESR